MDTFNNNEPRHTASHEMVNPTLVQFLGLGTREEKVGGGY